MVWVWRVGVWVWWWIEKYVPLSLSGVPLPVYPPGNPYPCPTLIRPGFSGSWLLTNIDSDSLAGCRCFVNMCIKKIITPIHSGMLILTWRYWITMARLWEPQIDALAQDENAIFFWIDLVMFILVINFPMLAKDLVSSYLFVLLKSLFRNAEAGWLLNPAVSSSNIFWRSSS